MTDTTIIEPKRRGRPPKVQIESRAEGEHDEAVEAMDDGGAADGASPADDAAARPDGGNDGNHETADIVSDGLGGHEAEHSEVVGIGLELAEGWSPMPTAPLSGKPVWLAALVGDSLRIPIFIAARWHATRYRERSPMRWVATGWWTAMPGGGSREPLKVEPLAWRLYQ